MKSLEIVKEEIKDVKEHIEYLTSVGYSYSDGEKLLSQLEQIKQDLEVLEILKKYITLDKEDSDPNDECAFYEDVLYMNINLEWDTTRVEATKLKKWLEGHK